LQKNFKKPLDKRKISAIIKVQKKETNKKCSNLSLLEMEKNQCTNKRVGRGRQKSSRDAAKQKKWKGGY